MLRLVQDPELLFTPLTAACVPWPTLKWVKNGFEVTGEFAGMYFAMPGQPGMEEPDGMDVLAGSPFCPHQ